MIAYYTRRFRSYSPILFRDFMLVAFAIPYHWSIPMDKYLQPSFLILFQVDLVKTRCPEPLSVVPRILWAYCYTVLASWIPLWIIPRAYRVSALSKLFMCFTKVFEIPFDLPKILSILLLLEFLLACIMVNPISLAILLASFVKYHFESIDSICCECSQSSIIS